MTNYLQVRSELDSCRWCDCVVFFQMPLKVELRFLRYYTAFWSVQPIKLVQYLANLFLINTSQLPWQRSYSCSTRMFGKIFVIIFKKAVGKLKRFVEIFSLDHNVETEQCDILLYTTWKLTKEAQKEMYAGTLLKWQCQNRLTNLTSGWFKIQ